MLIDVVCAIDCVICEYVVPESTLDLCFFAVRIWVRALFYAQNFIIAFFISTLIIGKKSVRYLNKLFRISVSVMLALSLVLPGVLICLVLYTSWGKNKLVLTLSNELPTTVLTGITAYIYYKTFHSIKNQVVHPRLVDSFLRIRRDVFLMAIVFILRASVEFLCLIIAAMHNYSGQYLWAQFVFKFQIGITGLCDAVIFGRLFRKSSSNR